MKRKITLTATAVFLLLATFTTINAQNTSLNSSSPGSFENPFEIKNGKTDVSHSFHIGHWIYFRNGNIGIGVPYPVQKIDVNGNINVAEDSGYYIGNQRVLNTKGGDENFFAGQSSGAFIQTGGMANTALGNRALYNNSTGDRNTAVGDYSLWLLDPGSDNVAVGYNSLTNFEAGDANTAIGSNALAGLQLGANNIAVGANAMSRTSGGLGTSQNIALGTDALTIHQFGDFNIAIGYTSLSSSFAGSNNTAVGTAANVNDSFNISNSTALGNEALLTASNQVRVGNGSIESIGGYKNWTKISDGRVKMNIKDNVPGLTFINKLKPVTYNLNLDVADKITNRPAIKDKKGKMIAQTKEQIAARKSAEKVLETGFIAQDVEKAAKELNYDFSGVDAAQSNKDLYGLRYADFVVPLVKAVQELSAQNEALKSENDLLKSRLDKIEQILTAVDAKAVVLSDARIEQNIPNPANNSTTINYYLPQNAGTASLNISDMNGKVLKTFSVSAKGNGQIVLQTNQLTAGTYQYSLMLNGKVVDTKKMIVAK